MAIPPELEAALSRLAKHIARSGDDPGRWLAWLSDIVKFRRDVWPTLGVTQKAAILAELRRLRQETTMPAATAIAVPTKFEGYCVKCKDKANVSVDTVDITKNGMKIAKGAHKTCGTTVCRILGKATAEEVKVMGKSKAKPGKEEKTEPAATSKTKKGKKGKK